MPAAPLVSIAASGPHMCDCWQPRLACIGLSEEAASQTAPLTCMQLPTAYKPTYVCPNPAPLCKQATARTPRFPRGCSILHAVQLHAGVPRPRKGDTDGDGSAGCHGGSRPHARRPPCCRRLFVPLDRCAAGKWLPCLCCQMHSQLQDHPCIESVLTTCTIAPPRSHPRQWAPTHCSPCCLSRKSTLSRCSLLARLGYLPLALRLRQQTVLIL